MGERVLIGTIVYGEYIDIFETVCMRSLLQSGNIPSLIRDGYTFTHTIYTRQDGELNRLKRIAEEKSREGYRIVIDVIHDGANLLFLHKFIDDGIKADAKSLFINPDLFFGNGSLKHLLAYKFKNDMCLAALHMRVDYGEFQEILKIIEGDVSNPQLVDIAMKCLHKSWSESFISDDTNNSNASGSAIEKVGNNLWAVTFRIPTVYLAKFTEKDRNDLSQFDFWDHEWPTQLMDANRYKFIGSSDMFFAVELTKTDTNIPTVEHYRRWNDDFHCSKKHSEVNRHFLAIVRGEDVPGCY